MRSTTRAFVAAALLLGSVASHADLLTLRQAARLAEAASPAVQAREAQTAAAEGARREAFSPLFNNPAVTLEAARRTATDTSLHTTEWSAGIAQPFETGGQQTWRRSVIDATQSGLRAEIDEARRQARADAALRFFAVLAAQRRVEIEQKSVDLLESTAQVVAKRRAAGEDTRLDANVALVEAERARNALAVAREKLLDARADLAVLLQLPPGDLPDVAGDLELPGPAAGATIANLLATAQDQPRHRALTAREQVARSRLGLERANRSPDVTVGLTVAREGFSDARERLTTLSVSVPLPLFKRNDAAVGTAISELTQAEVERRTALRDTQASVHRLWSRLQSQRERVERLRRTTLPAVLDNQQLSVKSRQAGQIGQLDQLLVIRQALEADRELNDALADFHATRIELDHIAGRSPEGTSE